MLLHQRSVEHTSASIKLKDPHPGLDRIDEMVPR